MAERVQDVEVRINKHTLSIAGQVYNLRADPFVSGHSDVASDATAYAILSAVAAA